MRPLPLLIAAIAAGRDGHKSDPSHFADSSGKAPYGSPDLCDEHGDFVVDRTGECDSEGWSYGASFEELCEPDQDEGETKGAEVTRRDSSAASVMSLGSIRTSRLPTVDEDDGDAEELKRTRMRRRRWLRRGSVAEQRTRERATEDAKQQLPAATPASPAALGGDLFGGILDALRAHRQHGISVRMENVDDKTVACVTGDTLLGFILEKCVRACVHCAPPRALTLPALWRRQGVRGGYQPAGGEHAGQPHAPRGPHRADGRLGRQRQGGGNGAVLRARHPAVRASVRRARVAPH